MLRFLIKKRTRMGLPILFAFAVFFHMSASKAGASDMEDVSRFLENAGRFDRNIEIPENLHKAQGQKEAGKLMEYYQSEAFRRKYEAEIERLKGTVFKDTLDSYYGDSNEAGKGNAKGGPLPGNERIYLFVSSSVPFETLRNYARDLDRLGDPNVFMVLRGFVGGMKRVKPTMDFVGKVITEDADCDIQKNKCRAYRVNVKIDPLLFRRYGITRVPAAVYAPDVRIMDTTLSEGMEGNAKTGDHYTLHGDASLAYMLETLRKESGRRSIEPLIEVLKGGIYHEVNRK
jgi:type-F conjugative transfer system pilin assembly protein TrbC